MSVKKINLVTVVGTRPEIIRLSRVINRLTKSNAFNHTLIHTGQNYDFELNEVFFEDLNLKKPDYFLGSVGKTPSETIGNILIKIDKLFHKLEPDAILILGDTNSCLCAIPAKKRKIPIFHIEAGNRCFDQRVPEEVNRKIIDHISDINLTYSQIAREYLLREGISPDRVIKIGSPMKEILSHNKVAINDSKILSKLKLKKDNYFLVSSHREENIDNVSNFSLFKNMLESLSKEFSLPIIVSTHPRTMKALGKDNGKLDQNIKFLKPFGYFDYVKLQQNAKVVLSDSGTITEESSILNFKALNIREVHERPEGMEEASVMMPGLNYFRVKQALDVLETQSVNQNRNISIVKDYNVDNFSIKVERIILSYIDFINRVVWQKES
jgi:UDP-N-acetylglucosamine 2-epimerase (non-hydrolysing)